MTIVQPSQSLIVQLYAPPSLHIYKRKLKIKYFLSLVVYKTLRIENKILVKELTYRVPMGW